MLGFFFLRAEQTGACTLMTQFFLITGRYTESFCLEGSMKKQDDEIKKGKADTEFPDQWTSELVPIGGDSRYEDVRRTRNIDSSASCISDHQNIRSKST
jgi:hypothetical protein